MSRVTAASWARARGLLKGPSETARIIHGPAQVRDTQPGPGPALPVHVQRNPSTPEIPRLLGLGG
eukprot:9821844-Alexandrium_andersonii.AAC.1